MPKREELKVSDVRHDFKFHMNKDMNPFWSMRSLLKPEWGELDFDVFLPSRGFNLQRPFVWTLFQKRQLILSVIKGIPLPKIALIQQDLDKDRSDRVFQVIDGKQRLGAIIEYLKGEYPIIVNDKEYFYEDLCSQLQGDIGTYSPRGDVAYSYWDKPISDDDKIAWFNQINFAGTPQDIEHMERLKGH